MTAELANALSDTPVPLSAPVADDTVADDAALGAIWDKAQAEGVSDEPGEEAPARPGPLRGADGKFTKAQETSPAGGEEGAAGDGDGSAAAPVIAAPAHLPQAVKAAWSGIPEDARRAIVESQTAADRKFADLGRQIEAVKPIADRLTEATTKFPQFAGMSPERLAQGAVELAAVQAALEGGDVNARAQTVFQIAQRYGVLPHLVALATGKQPDPAQSELAELRRKVEARREISPQDIDAKVADALRQRDTEAQITAFAKSKPLFAEVEASMPHFVQLVRERQPEASITDALEAAYDMAINADPTTRQKVRELEAQATTSQPDTKRAEAAAKAASINVKPSSAGRTRTMTEEEAMSAAYDRAMAN